MRRDRLCALCAFVIVFTCASACRAPAPWRPPEECAESQAVEASSVGAVTWHQHVRPMVERHCWPCHRSGDIGPFPIETYDQAASLHQLIGHSVRTASISNLSPSREKTFPSMEENK